MIVKHFDRGDAIEFTAAPVDENGNPIEPSEVTLYINFLGEDGREDITPITMTETTDGDFWGEWETAGIGAKAGRVYWCIVTASPDSASQGFFMLDVNLANPD